jgi:ABC-type multidrug transport system fused ATPase/permease subunit
MLVYICWRKHVAISRRRILYVNVNTPLKLARFMAEVPSIGLGETGAAVWWPTKDEAAQLGGELEFRDVSFSYPADRTKKLVLSNVNLRIPSGCMVGICGQTGCGKTTLLRLLERIYDPSEGVVTLGGCDLRKLDPRWLRQRA